MQIIEYDDCYSFIRERHRNGRETFDVIFNEGIIASFEKNVKKKRAQYPLVEVCFDKETYTFEMAENIWKTHEFHCYTTSNRKVSLCRDIIKLDKNKYAAIVIRDTETKMLLREQMEKLSTEEGFKELMMLEEMNLQKKSKEELKKQGVNINYIKPEDNDKIPKSKNKHLIKDFNKLKKEAAEKELKKGRKESEEDSIVSALSIMNARSLLEMPTDEDLIEFVEYFFENYGENEKLEKKIEYNWPQEPRIFRLANAAIEREEDKILHEQYENLSSSKKRAVNKLVDFLFSRPSWVAISFVYADGTTNSFGLNGNETEESRNEAKEFFRCACAVFLLEGGGATIRYGKPDFDKDTVCGIRATKQKFETISATEMKWCMENTPYGHQTFSNEVYERAEIFF